MTSQLSVSARRALMATAIGFSSVVFGCADASEDVSIGGTVESISSDESTALEIKLHEGKIRGQLVGNTRTFLGIPYAEAPVGDLRFAPPVPVEKWKGIRDALAFGPSCPQNPGGLAAPGPQSEDCLSLNVYAPQNFKGDLPVMVFIHGGAFVAGGSSQYDGKKLSEVGNVIVVTINYRLGALGLLSHPGLDGELSGDESSGNNMFRDQQLALEWVKRNIKRFGGDKHQVTLFGESAGAWSTCVNMVSPEAKQLADRYIMQSGTCVAGMAIQTTEQAQALGQQLSSELCAGSEDSIACLRGKPVTDIIRWRATAGITGAGFAPVIGNHVLPAHPSDLIADGAVKHKEVIVGSNAREWGLFQAIGASPRMTSVPMFHATLDATFGPISPVIKALYPATDATANGQFVNVMTDYLFRCPARQLAREVSAQKKNSVFLYHFEEGLAFHAFELPYVFGNPSASLGVPTEPTRQFVQNYWSTFAHAGDPNLNGQLAWPEYEAETDQHISLKGAPTVGANLYKAQCDFWNSLPHI